MSHAAGDRGGRYTPEEIFAASPPAPGAPRKETPVPADDPGLSALAEKGLLIGRGHDAGMYRIVCPWSSEHTNGDGEAAYWLANYGGYKGPGFKCLHAHCVDRTITDLRREMGLEAGVPGAEPPDFSGLAPENLTLTKEGAVKNTLENAIVLIEKQFAAFFGFDLFSQIIKIRKALPWNPAFPRALEDVDFIELAAWLGRHHRVAWSTSMVREAVEAVASRNAFHPVRNWLQSLVWDGTYRLAYFLEDIYGAPESDYCRAVSANWFTGAVARVMEPGCKVDTMPVFIGRQGQRKTMSFKVLFGAEWTSESVESVASKDFYQSIQGKWCIEFADLHTFKKTEHAHMKQMLSCTTDRFRPSYGRYPRDYPRQCVFVGTTNESEFLSDPTGNRRYWPVRVGDVNVDYIASARDQIFAEALCAYRSGRPWWQVPEAALADVHETHTISDSWEDLIPQWLASVGPGGTTTTDILRDALGIDVARHDRSAQTRAGIIMQRLGWRKKRVRNSGSFGWRFFRPPLDETT